MMGAVPSPSLVPALALLAALAAPVAWAGEEPVVPFPGTSVPGTNVSGTSVSGTSVSGAMVEGGQESFPEPGPEAAPVAAPDAGADVPGVAGRAVDAVPSETAAPGGSEAAEKPSAPPGGSRLLRALAERAESPVRETRMAAEPARTGSARVFAAEGCPRALLQRLLAGAADEADALSALGIEREILTLCRERQEILVGLFETEAALRELRMPPAAVAPEAAVRTSEAAAPPPATQMAPRAVAAASPSALLSTLTAAAEPPEDALPPEPRYAWFSIIGTAGALRAGITDGTGVWFVREGDALPGGATVAAIAGRPPGVRVTAAGEGGDTAPLPYRSRPGGGP